MNTMLEGTLQLLFPQRLCCHGCGCLLTQGEGLLCTPCQDALNRCTFKRRDEEIHFKPEQLLAASAYAYDGMAAELTRSLKYASDRAAAQPLAQGMAARFVRMPKLRAAEVCVAVPSYPKQARKRGYAQAQVLCDAFTQITGMPQATGALRRVRHAASQVGKTRDERKKQIVGAFIIHDAQAVRDKTVLLIDDVLTTGATACECARVLYAAGAMRVLALTACRA
ncbi:MAG TPA: phosphoribosyltransferase family protein [Candidatus Limiplasma sp.]|nr:phosphoribosyltransferase family protein [Candidatus Limiplasma sp.]HRX08938.1 phosphoribosyltransferase family protein [Candidatus Limiplasma sp.]